MLSLVRAKLTFKRPPASIIWVAVCYLWVFSGIGAFFPYLGVRYRQLGLDGAQIGLLSAISPIAIVILAPIWGMIADRYSAHRWVLRLALFPAAGLAVLLSQATTFAAILPLIIGWSICLAPVLPILDSYAVALGEQHGVTYGRLRLWGTVGYMFAVLAVGWWTSAHPTGSFLVIYASLLFLAMLSTFGLPAHPGSAHIVGPQTSRGLGVVLRQPALVILLVSSFLVSIGMNAFGNFFGIYIIELGGNASLIGLANAMVAISEAPIMLASAAIQTRLGYHRMFVLSLSAYILRFVLYSLAPSAGFVIPIQLFHGLSYAIFLVASIRMVHQFAGAERAATAQSLLASAMALGSISGAFLNGALYDRFGVVSIFRMAALITVASLSVYVGGFYRLRRSRQRVA